MLKEINTTTSGFPFGEIQEPVMKDKSGSDTILADEFRCLLGPI
jgi:hypothetical protein